MYNEGFIGRRISDDWLVSKRASIYFALSSFLIVATFWFLGTNLPLRNLGIVGNIFCGAIGVSGGAGMFFLWGGMWRYWTLRNQSNRWIRGIWFVVLFFGMIFGPVLYYLCIYLPTRTKQAKRLQYGL